MDEIQKFRAYIKEKGLRNTPERERIVREIFSSHDHFDVDELFLRMKNRNKIVSKASLYRTIPLLVESGLIKEVFLEDGHLHYEHVYGHKHHCHLRCNCCGRIIEFADDGMAEIHNKVGKKYGFMITSHRCEVSGYCSQCAEDQRGRKARTPSGKGWTRDQKKSAESC